jgi:hypothetical protein
MLKENFNKIKSIIGRKNGASVVGGAIGILFVVFLIILIVGALVIFCLNLMGLDLEYTIKSCIGAGLLIFAIRPTSSKE